MSLQKKNFATGKRSRVPREALKRKIWVLWELLCHKRLSFERYIAHYPRAGRTFQRDLEDLRPIAQELGHSISDVEDGYVTLTSVSPRVRALHRQATANEQLIGHIVRAFGRAIAAEMGLAEEPETEEERFFHYAVPSMIEGDGTRTLAIREALKNAWMSRALVKFVYPDNAVPGGSRDRLVEPHRVLYRSGVDYLVAYDRERKDWRTFALDRFLSTPVPAGTNNSNRKIAPEYASDDVLGFMRSDQPKTEVTVEFSRFVAASAVSRRWQAAQRVEPLDGGRARIVFLVGEPSEVVRWAFGFGKDAKIVAPAETVRLARDMARAIATQHEVETPE